MKIDRCVCTNKTFKQLHEYARDHGEDVEALGRSCGAGAKCGLCRPYLRKTLATGQTVFHHVVVEPAGSDSSKEKSQSNARAS